MATPTQSAPEIECRLEKEREDTGEKSPWTTEEPLNKKMVREGKKIKRKKKKKKKEKKTYVINTP